LSRRLRDSILTRSIGATWTLHSNMTPEPGWQRRVSSQENTHINSEKRGFQSESTNVIQQKTELAVRKRGIRSAGKTFYRTVKHFTGFSHFNSVRNSQGCLHLNCISGQW
jgi:hypothetical protein